MTLPPLKALLSFTPLLVACTQLSMPEPDEGAQIYAENCAICHGMSGKGDGAIAAEVTPRPVDLTLLAMRNGGVFPRAAMLSQVDGYTRMQHPGQEMPEFGLLLGGDTVPVDLGDGQFTPVPRPLAALMTYLESLQAE